MFCVVDGKIVGPTRNKSVDWFQPTWFILYSLWYLHKARRPHTSTMAPIRNYMWGSPSEAKLAALVALAFLTRLALQENRKKICCKKFMDVVKIKKTHSLLCRALPALVGTCSACTSEWWTYCNFFLEVEYCPRIQCIMLTCYWTWIWSVALNMSE